ncbi:hypothetical protein [Streptomyces sp. NPDC050982]|uniref:hypothetical protein n=1 Tax=Streptomyces sp. NPDC050982 TaxID=3154746 RepID=UPI0033DD980E
MTASSSGSSSADVPQQVGLRGDARFEGIAHASWWQMAAQLPRTLAAAARLGWAADRPAMLMLDEPTSAMDPRAEYLRRRVAGSPGRRVAGPQDCLSCSLFCGRADTTIMRWYAAD